jgi:hypothetical protein
VTAPTARLAAKIAADFGPAHEGDVIGWLSSLSPEAYGGQDVERVQSAMVLAAAGDWRRFTAMGALLREDWRDVLVAGGLAHADWAERLDQQLTTIEADT